MHIETTNAAIKRFEAIDDPNATIEDWSLGMLTDEEFMDAAEKTFCQRHDYPNRRYSAHGLRVDVPECTCPEPEPLEVTLERNALETAIQANQTSPGWETRLNVLTGTFVSVGENGQRIPTVARDVPLVPLPCMDPEGSGRANDRFQEFCHEAMPEHLPSYHAYCEETGCDELGYLADMETRGWDSAVEAWLASEAEHLDWLIDQWVECARTGYYEAGDGLLEGHTECTFWNSEANEEVSFPQCHIDIQDAVA